MQFEAFHNALRIMRSIDKWELADAIGADRAAEIWSAFRTNPSLAFLLLGDREARAIFSIVERRQPKRDPAADLSCAMGGDGDLLKTLTDIVRPVVP